MGGPVYSLALSNTQLVRLLWDAGSFNQVGKACHLNTVYVGADLMSSHRQGLPTSHDFNPPMAGNIRTGMDSKAVL